MINKKRKICVIALSQEGEFIYFLKIHNEKSQISSLKLIKYFKQLGASKKYVCAYKYINLYL